jgi:sporulation protein YlmC with PRC-barrel domain
LASVDEGLPIAYEVLDPGVEVYSRDGEPVGTVEHVVAAPAEDIFHGIVIRVGSTRRFVAPEQIESLHERGVDLRIEATAVQELPEPHGSAPARRVLEPGVRPSHWKQLLDMVSGAQPHRRDWTDEQ